MQGRPVVYMHIGAPKTGTTWLQRILWRNRPNLRKAGVLYPGPPNQPAHFKAALDLRGVGFGYGKSRMAQPVGAWDLVAEEARAWPGRTVISHEVFVWASEDQVRRAVDSLAPADVHIVFTARDLVRQLPAVWQEDVKNGHTLPFDDFIRDVAEPGANGRSGEWFWGAQAAHECLPRWASVVGDDQVHVVTVPPSGSAPELLWGRFAGCVGIDGLFEPDLSPEANPSMGLAETEMLRRVNLALNGRLPWHRYERLIKRRLAEKVLAQRPDKVRIDVPPAWYPWAYDRSVEVVEGLRASGYDIVGSLEDLIPPSPDERPGDKNRELSSEDVLEAAVDTLADTLLELHRRAASREAMDGSADGFGGRARENAGKVLRRAGSVVWQGRMRGRRALRGARR